MLAEFVQWVLHVLGIPADLGPNPSGLVVGLLLFAFGLAAYSVFRFCRWVVRTVKRQIENGYWTDVDKVVPLVHLVLLVVSYGFYTGHETRTLGAAVKDLVTERIAGILPLAIVTQWALMLLFWFVLGRLIGIGMEELLFPVRSALLGLIAGWLQVLAFTPVWLALVVRHDTAHLLVPVLILLASTVVSTYLSRVAYHNSEYEVQRAGREPGQPVTLWNRLVYGKNPASRWRIPPMQLLGGAIMWPLADAFIASLVGCVYILFKLRPPSATAAFHVELLVFALLFLSYCYFFRETSIDDGPPALAYFVDLSLALSAATIALVGVADSGVTIGSVPPWVIGVVPPLAVALLVFSVHVQRYYDQTPRWGTCLAVSVVAGLLVGPIRVVLTFALTPLMKPLMKLMPLG